MVRSATERAFDLVIVVATGGPAEYSLRLQAELLRLDLLVQLEIAPAPSVGDLPPLTQARVSQAAYSGVLMTVRADDGDEETGFVTVPAPRHPGQSPTFVQPGTTVALPGSIETGMIGDDVAALAGRIAERVRTR